MKLCESIKTLSSGTIGSLINCNDLDMINLVQNSFLEYSLKLDEDLNWKKAWELFKNDKFNKKTFYCFLVELIMLRQKENLKIEEEFLSISYNECFVLTNDVLELAYSVDSNEFRLTRVENDNPVLQRDSEGKVFRFNGEICFLDKELLRLAKISKFMKLDSKRE